MSHVYVAIITNWIVLLDQPMNSGMFRPRLMSSTRLKCALRQWQISHASCPDWLFHVVLFLTLDIRVVPLATCERDLGLYLHDVTSKTNTAQIATAISDVFTPLSGWRHPCKPSQPPNDYGSLRKWVQTKSLTRDIQSSWTEKHSDDGCASINAVYCMQSEADRDYEICPPMTCLFQVIGVTNCPTWHNLRFRWKLHGKTGCLFRFFFPQKCPFITIYCTLSELWILPRLLDVDLRFLLQSLWFGFVTVNLTSLSSNPRVMFSQQGSKVLKTTSS